VFRLKAEEWGVPLPGALHHQHRDIIRLRPLLLSQADKPVNHFLGFCRAVQVGVRPSLTPFPLLWEPPGADPHARWCGGWGREPPGYPIRHFFENRPSFLKAYFGNKNRSAETLCRLSRESSSNCSILRRTPLLPAVLFAWYRTILCGGGQPWVRA
jgi:hypothetical protein